MLREKLLQTLQQYITAHPEDAPEALATITLALCEFRHTMEQSRNAITLNALNHSLDAKWFKRQSSTSMIPLAYAWFPHGAPAGGSQNEHDFWELFTNACRKLPIDLKWLKSVWSPEMARWAAENLDSDMLT